MSTCGLNFSCFRAFYSRNFSCFRLSPVKAADLGSTLHTAFYHAGGVDTGTDLQQHVVLEGEIGVAGAKKNPHLRRSVKRLGNLLGFLVCGHFQGTYGGDADAYQVEQEDSDAGKDDPYHRALHQNGGDEQHCVRNCQHASLRLAGHAAGLLEGQHIAAVHLSLIHI